MESVVRGIPIHYEEFGEGGPPILIHGLTLDSHVMVRTYEPVFAGRDGWRRIHLDMPGHGRTPGPDWLSTDEQLLDVLLECIDSVIGGERLVLIGNPGAPPWRWGWWPGDGPLSPSPHTWTESRSTSARAQWRKRRRSVAAGLHT